MGRTPALLFSLVLAFTSGLALSSPGEAAHPIGASPRGAALDTLEVGQSVSMNRSGNGNWQIMVIPAIEKLAYEVVEIGTDYATLRDVAGISDRLVPIYAIDSIETLLTKER